MTNYFVYLSPLWSMGLANHIWQSTLFAAAVWLLAAAFRRNQARVRYALWMVASLKFLVPFSVLVSVGELIRWPSGAHITQPSFSPFVDGIANPFPSADVAALPSPTQMAHPLSCI